MILRRIKEGNIETEEVVEVERTYNTTDRRKGVVGEHHFDRQNSGVDLEK